MDREAMESPGNVPQRTLLVFQVADQQYAVSSADVAEILPMAELQSPPGTPKVLAGFLNVACNLIPVIRLHHLFGLPETPLERWTPLVILRVAGRRLGLLVDSVNRTLVIDEEAVRPLPLQHVSKACVIGVVRTGTNSLSLLSPQHLLLEQEQCAVAELQQLVQQRIDELDGVTA